MLHRTCAPEPQKPLRASSASLPAQPGSRFRRHSLLNAPSCAPSCALSCALLFAPALQAQPPKAAAPTMLVDIVLEQKTPSGVQQMPQEHVFEPGDILRFRIVSRYTGFMYVMDQGTSGRYATIFPSDQAGSENHLATGSSYLVPATPDGWFQVEGPAGFEILYFLLSPTAVAPMRPSFIAPGPLSSLKPRCNDGIFKARGECIDSSAGPSALPPNAELPAPLAPLAGSASRDIVFTHKADATSVASAAGSSAPVIYTFRLAHH